MSVKVFSGNRMIDTVKGYVIEKKISILVENEIIVAIDSPDKISSHPLFENSEKIELSGTCLLYTSPSPRDVEESRMPSSA